MKFFTAFTAVITLISSVAAAPTISSDLETRANECPSVETIENWVRTHTRVGAKTVFYTGTTATNQNAKDYAATIGGEYWGSVYPTDQFLDWIEECGVGVEQNKLVPRMAQALAQATTGQAYVLFRRGEVLAPGSVWMQNEWPALQGRVPVTAVNALKVSETLANWTPDSHFKRDSGLDDTSD
ncbi:hypothetical protein MFRU_006g00630 [Monilinia fructicola]|uniref:Uncharacterized protein n=1 Tax=Monilinia fructicola TaxID=38448 RepID=A0A5M9JA83_MONFR|nr:hypothetical protein EYC84_009339 [Monilinia fructicola]KAG4032593.1 hypothetical protein MFRU_006g00630 [Monilinia fructicola]